jgi:hypothetical protein
VPHQYRAAAATAKPSDNQDENQRKSEAGRLTREQQPAMPVIGFLSSQSPELFIYGDDVKVAAPAS